jgi:hypothetical protein
VIAARVNEITASFAGLCHVPNQIFEVAHWNRPMKYTHFPSIHDASPTSLTCKRKLNSGRSFFARLIDALHVSRRLQAGRVIRQCRHLIHEARAQDDAGKTAENRIARDRCC